MCDKLFERAQPFSNSVPIWGSTLSLSGGYAEFFDYGDENSVSTFTLRICHDCTLPIFRKIMASEKYAHLKMHYFELSHQFEDGQRCCEYGYNPKDYF